jgi:hypothetical protein
MYCLPNNPESAHAHFEISRRNRVHGPSDGVSDGRIYRHGQSGASSSFERPRKSKRLSGIEQRFIQRHKIDHRSR